MFYIKVPVILSLESSLCWIKSLSEGRPFCQSDLFIKIVEIIFSKVIFGTER